MHVSEFRAGAGGDSRQMNYPKILLPVAVSYI